jgi:2-iminobutanoate/2-iminopropanoate deaminase
MTSIKREPVSRPGASLHVTPGLVDGVRIGGWIFLSSIRGRDPMTLEIPDDPEQQARNAFENLRVLLSAAGAGFEHVAKVNLYLQDMKYRDAFNTVWREVFPENPPARTGMQVTDVNMAGSGAFFVIDVIAIDPAYQS